MMNHAGWTLSVQYDESCRLDFVRPVQSRAKQEHVFVNPVRGIKQARLRLSGQSRTKVVLVYVQPEGGINPAGLRLFDTKTRKRRACSHLSGTRNHAGGTSSIWYKVTQKESLSSFVWYGESSRRDFVHPVRCRMKRELVLVRLVGGIKLTRLHLSGTKSRKEILTTSVRYDESSRWDFVRLIRNRANGGLVLVRPLRGI